MKTKLILVLALAVTLFCGRHASAQAWDTVRIQTGATATTNGQPARVNGRAIAAFQITGITTATITFEGTVNGTDYVALPAENVASGTVATTATANGIYRARVAGLLYVRARVSAYTSGTIVVDCVLTGAGDVNGVSSGGGAVTIADGADSALGATTDAAATAGSTGTVSAKMRLQTSQLDSIKTAVETIDNAVSGSGVNVSQMNGVAVTMGNGVSGTGVQRVTLASDSTGQVAVSSIAAGNNNIGDVDVATIAAGDNNIGNVDVVTVPADPFGANADAAATAGSTGSMQAKLRLITSQLDAVQTAVQLIDNTVSGTGVNVSQMNGVNVTMGNGVSGTGVQRVTIASDSTGVVGLSAGENHVGQVGTPGIAVTSRPTISTSAYTAGDNIGGKITLSSAVRVSAGKVRLDSITIVDQDNEKAALEIFLFDRDPTAATLTDNAALAFSTNDIHVIGRISVTAGDYVTLDSKAFATLSNLGIFLQANAGTSLYAAVAVTGTPTYTGTDDLQFVFGFTQY
ncbi:MAG: hypothetical protein AB1705_08550 [Verrucomicrobiota bacterium]